MLIDHLARKRLSINETSFVCNKSMDESTSEIPRIRFQPTSFHYLFRNWRLSSIILPSSFASLENRRKLNCRFISISVESVPYRERGSDGFRNGYFSRQLYSSALWLSVTSWRDNTLSLFVRLHGVSSAERRPPFVAWANVFYSIKQTRYLVGKLVRTQRCDVGALRESREGKRYPLADIFKGLTSHLAAAGGLNGPPIRLPFSFHSPRDAWFIKLRVPPWVERKFNVPWSRMEKETSRKIRPS